MQLCKQLLMVTHEVPIALFVVGQPSYLCVPPECDKYCMKLYKSFVIQMPSRVDEHTSAMLLRYYAHATLGADARPMTLAGELSPSFRQKQTL
jgi:hypothetical protein